MGYEKEVLSCTLTGTWTQINVGHIYLSLAQLLQLLAIVLPVIESVVSVVRPRAFSAKHFSRHRSCDVLRSAQATPPWASSSSGA